MKIPLYVVDAFAERPFNGNPAAICVLEAWLPEATMQAIAAEMNLSETAFLVLTEQGWHIRWFTPTLEVDLVGHATLAAAFVIFERSAPQSAELRLSTDLAQRRSKRWQRSTTSPSFPMRRRCAGWRREWSVLPLSTALR